MNKSTLMKWKWEKFVAKQEYSSILKFCGRNYQECSLNNDKSDEFCSIKTTGGLQLIDCLPPDNCYKIQKFSELFGFNYIPEMRHSSCAFACVHVHWILSAVNCALLHSVGLFDVENWSHFDRVMFVLLLCHHSRLCHHFANLSPSFRDRIVVLAKTHTHTKKKKHWKWFSMLSIELNYFLNAQLMKRKRMQTCCTFLALRFGRTELVSSSLVDVWFSLVLV